MGKSKPWAATFKVIAELPSLALSFGARDFFPPFWGADVPADFRTSFVLLSSLEDFSLPLTSEIGVEGGLFSPTVKEFFVLRTNLENVLRSRWRKLALSWRVRLRSHVISQHDNEVV